MKKNQECYDAFDRNTWYKVSFTHSKNNLLELSAWCSKHTTGKFIYQYTAPVFWFEQEQDAMFFKLLIKT